MRPRWIAVALCTVAPCAGLVAGCGGSEPETAARGTKPPVLTGAGTTGTGRLVAIGDGRSLYMECLGSGSPTVLLEAGFGGDSSNWSGVHEALAKTTRTCVYDRAGLGSSVGTPGVHDANDEIRDLERLVGAAKLAPPYVLVGHSYGGLLVRLFAHAHPDQTAGLVLVDSMGPNQTVRHLRVWPRSILPADRSRFAAPVIEGVDLRAGEQAAGRIRSLGDVPLAVVTAGRHQAEFANFPRRLRMTFGRLWTTMQDELAALSSDHVHVVALRSDHFVQALDGQPGVVLRAVSAVVGAARTHAPLPPCSDVFTGGGVHCRS
jgi:pimeloyl-ACP methyl ester carboxylesterase